MTIRTETFNCSLLYFEVFFFQKLFEKDEEWESCDLGLDGIENFALKGDGRAL